MQACAAKYSEMFRDTVGIDYSTLYSRLIERVLRRHIYTQFVQLVDLLANMEQLIISKITKLSAAGKAINVSLPDIFMLPHIDELIVYRPDVLRTTVNKIIDYVNKININSIITNPVSSKIPHVAAISATPIAGDTQIADDRGMDAAGYIEKMHAVLAHEIVVAGYICAVEKYHVEVINHMNQIYDVCKKIIAGLIS